MDWPLGTAKACREAANVIEKKERKSHPTDVDLRNENVDVVITAGEAAIRVTGNVLRKADRVQAIRHKRPPKLVEGILLELVENLLGEPISDVFFQRVAAMILKVPSGKAYKEWLKTRAGNIQRIEELLDRQLPMTNKECKGFSYAEFDFLPLETPTIDSDKVEEWLDKATEEYLAESELEELYEVP
tara:strand:+ start:3449 stop:4009 length:561 start_codon:yes stop_codon:yes gene_type:complete